MSPASTISASLGQGVSGEDRGAFRQWEEAQAMFPCVVHRFFQGELA